MSIIIQTATAAAANGLPKLQRLAYGFPVTGLAGLYLLEDGTVGQPYSSIVKDSSGLGNDATARSGRATPLRAASGIAVSDLAGVCYDTPIAQSNDFTAIIVSKVTGFDGTTGHGLPMFLQNSLDVPASTAAAATATHGLKIGVDEQDASALKAFTTFSTAPAVQHVVNPVASANWENLSAIGVSFDHTLGRTRISGSGQSAAFTDAGLKARTMSDDGGFFSFGIMKYYTEARLTGEVHLVAIYNTLLSDTAMDAVIATAKARVAARGVTVA